MLNILIWSIILVFSSSLFSLSYSYSGVSRSFTGLGKGIAESSVIVIDSDGSNYNMPYFSIERFEDSTKSYFDSALKRYLPNGKKPEYEFVFFDTALVEASDEVPERPTGVKVAFSCPVSVFLTYKNHVTFFIKRGLMYGK